ncbi:MAG: glucosylceramidase [Acidobacteria bacterium]|nr:glucosylceramidase [Acidobacteriota bacterium]
MKLFCHSVCAFVASVLVFPSCFAQKVTVHPVSPDNALNPLPAQHLSFGKLKPSVQVGTIIHVDDKQRFQTMDGFGASLTDSSAWLLETQLSPALRKETMRALFDPEHGAGLSFLRQPLGASDLSLTHYSYDDMPAGKTDAGVTKFSIAHDETYILPALREALRLNPKITVMATPWSPPGWMKTSDSMNGGSLREDAMAEFATYLVKSVHAYGKAGVPIVYLSVQNEPLYETKDYPGMLMRADQQKHFIGEYLGPALDKAALHPKLLAYDHNWDHPEYPLEVLSYAPAAKYLSGTAFHCYGGRASAQDQVHDAYPQLGLWMTECSGGTWQKDNLLAATSRLILESTQHWAKSVVLWGIALDTEHGPHLGGCGTCRGLVEIDRTRDPHTVKYTIDFYAMQAASKYVRPGAVRIASTDFGRQGLQTAAFQNKDGSIALLVLNNAEHAEKWMLEWKGHFVAAEIPAGSLATYVWK